MSESTEECEQRVKAAIARDEQKILREPIPAMKYLALISIVLVACDAGPAQLNEVARAPNECPEPSAKLDVAKARFREHLPKADPSQYEIKSGVFSGKVVYSFVPTSAYRTFGDSPSVVFDCVSQTALFLPGE